MIKRDNFVNIMGWMVTDLGLSGASLIIYAVIYGFTQDGETSFQGSRQYLADWCGCSISGVKKCLKQLQEVGLIEQVYHSKDNLQVYYKANTEPRTLDDLGHKVTKARAQSDQGIDTKVTKARAQSNQAYKEDNIEDKLNDNIADSIVVCDTPAPARFQKPTIEEVKAYAERNGKALADPERFYDFYEANGWKVGKNKMKDWRAAFRNWERTEKAGRAGGSVDRLAEHPILENEYTPEHLAQREAESRQLLDDLLREGEAE